MKLTGSAKIAGVAGWPVAHSLSPLLHGHWIEEYGLDAAYVPFAIQPEDFRDAVEGLRLAGVKGLNVTVPHKQTAFAMADETGRRAKIAGAANLLVFRKNGIFADNTDNPGLIATLNAAMGAGAMKSKTAVILGAGGMARAALCALDEMGAAKIVLLARTLSRGEALVREVAPMLAVEVSAAGFSAWETAASGARLLINATSAGMNGLPPLDLPLTALPARATVFDAVYNPLRTDLLVRAERRGLQTIDGLGLLMHQAVPSFEAFFGVRPQVTAALRQKLEKALHA